MFWVDIIILILIAFGAWQGFRRGFMAQLFQILSVIAAFIVALLTYPILGNWFEKQLQIPVSFARPIALTILLTLLSYVFQIVAGLAQKLIAPILEANPINRAAGSVLGALRQIMFISITLALLLALPLPETIKQNINKAPFAKLFTGLALRSEQALAKVFHNDAIDSLNYRIIQEDDTTTTALNYFVADPVPDTAGEAKLFLLTNATRDKAGHKALVSNDGLRDVARAHARDMLQKGYFSHISPQGKDAVARLKDASITVVSVGENLATAPSVEIAHAGLLASEGHRRNILNADFNTVGIAVLDAGTHGKMIVEVFAKIP